MKAGTSVQLGKGELVTCLRSSADGGRFEYEVRLEPGVDGPPMHSHAEGPEVVEIVSGSIEFYFKGEPTRTLRAGDRLEIAAGQVHTFKNVSKTDAVVARGSHGPRFERAVDQYLPGGPVFTRLCRYLVGTDPHASYMHSRVVRAMMRGVALIGRLRGVQIA